MVRPRTFNGTLLGLIGAALILGLWAIRKLAPVEKSPVAIATTQAPLTAVSTLQTSEQPKIISPEQPELPTEKNTPTPAVPSLIAQIETALSIPDVADWEHVLNELFPALLATDRLAAARLVDSLPPGEKRRLLLQRLARAWATVDFAGAVTWLSNLTEFAEQKIAFDEACFAAAEHNPAEAIHAWESFDFKEDDHVLENLVQHWARLDLNAAQAWVRARPPSLQRDQAVARVVYIMAHTNPAEAATFAIREIPSGPALTEAVISILYQWAKNDRTAAAAWVEQFPAGPLADRAKKELAGLAP